MANRHAVYPFRASLAGVAVALISLVVYASPLCVMRACLLIVLLIAMLIALLVALLVAVLIALLTCSLHCPAAMGKLDPCIVVECSTVLVFMDWWL